MPALIIGLIVWVVLALFAWACCAIAGDADDRMMRRYQREKRAFEEFFE